MRGFATKSNLALVLAYTLWGINTPVIKLGIQSVPPLVLLCIKILAAFIIITPLALRHWQPLTARDWRRFLAASFLWISVGNVLNYYGLERAPSINAAFIGLFGPLLLFVLSVRILKERLKTNTLAGLIVAMLGAVVIIGLPVFDGWADDKSVLIGNLMFIPVVITHVVATIITKPVVAKASTYQAAWIMFLAILPMSAITFYSNRDWSFASVEPGGWIAIIYGILTVVCSHVLLTYGLKHKLAEEVGVFAYIQPLLAVAAAALILHEYPSLGFVLGAFLIGIGVYLAEAHLPHIWRLHYHRHHH
jgi:drug/metabolite transporter (DMT)-like permease